LKTTRSQFFVATKSTGEQSSRSFVRANLPRLPRSATLGSTLIVFAFCLVRLNGGKETIPPLPALKPDEKPALIFYSYEVIHTWPHDPAAFTQGLVFNNGEILESTGLNGESTLREVDLGSGNLLKKISLTSEYFAEGLTVIGARAYQVTWQNGTGFIYDAATFQRKGQFKYEGEGWGLTTDGQLLILSDGTDQLRFIDPSNFGLVRTLRVTASGRPVRRLNELEWIKGEIFANVWLTNQVVRIDPLSGVVRGIIDFSGLLSSADRKPDTDVLNGIAYDAARDKLVVTGKRWPKIFEVRLIPGLQSPE
jgi:glutaminyl-peptide cyclotransferase